VAVEGVIRVKPISYKRHRFPPEVDVAVHALNRMLDLGRPNYVRIA
jgi:hypothetical protein